MPDFADSMPRPSSPLTLLWVLALASAIGVAPASAQDGAPPEDAPEETRTAEIRMPVKVVGDRLVVRCELSTRSRRIPANLFVAYDRPCGLELHNRAADWMRVDAGGGQPITIHLPGDDIVVERRGHGDEEQLEEFTKLYSKELGETSCLGTIGAEVLGNYHVRFDLNAGFVTLRPAAEKTSEPPAVEEGSELIAVTLRNDLVWLPVRLADGRIMSLALGSSRYDSVVDEELCEELDRPAGDIGSVTAGTFDLSRCVAWRPVELVQVHADGALGVLGLSLLEHFRIEVDRVNGHARLSGTAPADFPEDDLAYFRAMVEDEPEPLLEALEAHPEGRMAREASELLVDLLLDTRGAPEEFQKALEWMDRTRIDDLRTTEALATMERLVEARRPDVAIVAGTIGVESGRDDRYPDSIHRVHARLGELLLESGDDERAWEHLLSAAFGIPEDGTVNLNLGRFYERQKRYARALSRYVQAVIVPESGPQAVAGLERVQEAMGGEPLSVDLVDKLVQGRVHNFSAATRFDPPPELDSNRCVLAELFTNAHFGREVREGWVSFAVGGAMAAEGLLSHFDRQHLVLLSYHIDRPEPTALQNPLSMHMATLYGVDGPFYIKINGTETGPGAARWRQGEVAYEQNRTLVLDELQKPTRFDLTGSAKVEDGIVSGQVKVRGPEDPNLVLQVILAERGALYPGKAVVVVHRMVARYALTEDLDGIPYRPVDGVMAFDFSKRLADVSAANVRYLEQYEAQGNAPTTRLSTRLDARQVAIVALVRDRRTLAVKQALHIDPEGVSSEGTR